MHQDQENERLTGDISNALALEVFKAIAHAVMVKGGNMQHLRRIIEEPTLQRSIADLVFPVGSEIKYPLVDDECLVYVDYDIPLDRVSVKANFPKNGVSDLVYGNYEWQLHSSCAKIDQTSGERIMLAKCFGREMKSEEAIAEMDKLGYRPATHLEAYAFAKAQSELGRRFWIVALGSYTLDDGCPYNVTLVSGPDGRINGSFWFTSRWSSGLPILFVRKNAK